MTHVRRDGVSQMTMFGNVWNILDFWDGIELPVNVISILCLSGKNAKKICFLCGIWVSLGALTINPY